MYKKGFQQTKVLMDPIHLRRSRQLYTLAVSMGGVLIKLCQFLSTRQDMLPTPYITTLKTLQDDVPPVPFELIDSIITEEYPDRRSIFESIEPIPLASASLGQVHRAVLKSGETVILKILKPGITELIDLDLAILSVTFRFFSHIKFFTDRLDFESVLEEFARVTGEELNFKREVSIAKQMRQALSKNHSVVIPKIYEQFCTDRIIVMEYIEGNKITEKKLWLDRNNNPEVICRHLIELYLEQFLSIKMIHYDPHPGNILVLDNNRIALLDFGMAGQITEKMSLGIKQALIALMNDDYEAILTILDSLGFFRAGTDIYQLLPIIEFFFEKVITTVKLERESVMAIDLSPIVDDLIELLYTQPVQLPVEWAYIGRTVGTLVGITSSLYPNINLYFKRVIT
ncbi:MAG: AarF/ABC1/UbiB kinase family protein [Chitinivibrionales bacterium]|nr:AarF/ABC1/UbiB kinase family protein [Chitinivibrionales bacterium]